MGVRLQRGTPGARQRGGRTVRSAAAVGAGQQIGHRAGGWPYPPSLQAATRHKIRSQSVQGRPKPGRADQGSLF